MPILAGLLVEMVVGFAGILAKWFTQKVAVTVIVVAQLTVIYVAFYASSRALLSGLSSAAVGLGPMFGAGVQMIISKTTAGSLSGYLVFWVSCELFKWRFTLIQLWGRVL